MDLGDVVDDGSAVGVCSLEDDADDNEPAAVGVEGLLPIAEPLFLQSKEVIVGLRSNFCYGLARVSASGK